MSKAIKITDKGAKTAPKIPQTQKNHDGWMNVVTGMGTGKDKNTYAEINWKPYTQYFCENLFAGDEMAQKIAKIIPYDGTREAVTWGMEEGAPAKDITKFLDSEFNRLRVWPTLAWAWTVARVYGGSAILISVDGGSKDLETPLKLEQVKKVKALRVFDRFSLQVNSFDLDADLSSPRFGEPVFYTYIPKTSAKGDTSQVKIHHSRLIRIDGIRLPENLWIRNGYWHDSIYGSLWNAIRNYASTHESISQLISGFNQPVYRIEGLSEAIAMDQEVLISKKLQIVDLMRSTARAIVLDKEDEFQNVSTNVAGGKDLVDLTVQRLVAGSDIPHTRLLGNSPTGLGATGKSELINYYDSVRSMQETTLRDPIEKLTDLVFSQTGALDRPEDLAFEFSPLFQQDQEIEIKTRNYQAEVDKKYIELGVITPDEVAESRYSSGRYSFETTLKSGIERVKPEMEGGVSPSRGPSAKDINTEVDDLSDL